MGGRLAGIAVFALLAAPAAAGAHGSASPPVAGAAGSPPESCPGREMQPDRVITGSFGSELEGSYVLLPFTVSEGTTAVRVKYCHDQPESQLDDALHRAPAGPSLRHTLDLGLYETRADPSKPWGVDEFRGWGGSSHPDVIVSPQGFSSEQAYRADLADGRPAPGNRPGRTTRAFLPGPIPAGEWAVELGVAAVATREEGDADGAVAWRVEIDLQDDESFDDEPYEPAEYDGSAVPGTGPGWYAGDLHVHGEHSALGDAPMRDVFDYAFGEAGLDFITLSDYVSGSAWGEIGRFQEDYPENVIIRSAEVITYRGHLNDHGSAEVVDYRTGPLYVRAEDGTLTEVRGARPASAIFDAIRAAGGFTQINHPTIFPSQVPTFSGFCRGCPWDYSAEETQYGKVDAIEIATGPAGLKQPPQPGPNPFTVTAIEFWEDALARGHKIAAVGASDSHHAGETPNQVTQAPIGQATTVVRADDLSPASIQAGIEAGHTYVKVFGNDGPDLRFEARVPGSSAEPAIMGDTVRAEQVDFTARVMGAGRSAEPPRQGAYQLLVVKDGEPLLAVPIASDDFTLPFPSIGPGRYRLQVQRGSAIEAVSSPIYVEPPAAQGTARRPACAGGKPAAGCGAERGRAGRAGRGAPARLRGR